MSGSPLSELSTPKAMANSDDFKLFPLKSGPRFGDASLSRGASGVVFTGYTKDAAFDNDAFSCCGNYTLRNSVHAAIAATTPDGCTIFALKSVIDQRPCLAVGGFDKSGKPVELTKSQFEKLTLPLSNPSNVSPILGSEPALGVQLRNANSTYGFKYNAQSDLYIFNYTNSIAGDYGANGKPRYERSSGLALEHNGHELSKVSANTSWRRDNSAFKGSVFQDLNARGFELSGSRNDWSGTIAKTYMEGARTDKYELGYGATSISRESTTGGRITEGVQHKFEGVVLKVTRTRDRVTGNEYMLTFTFELP